MKRLILNEDARLGPWICQRLGTTWLPGRGSCIGLEDDTGIVVGVLFDSFNGASVFMHVAAVPGKSWMDRKILWICFDYPFNQLKVKKIFGLVEEGNQAAREFDENLGFVREATLTDAAPSGSLLVYSMTRSQCRWLNMRSPFHGQARCTAAA